MRDIVLGANNQLEAPQQEIIGPDVERPVQWILRPYKRFVEAPICPVTIGRMIVSLRSCMWCEHAST